MLLLPVRGSILACPSHISVFRLGASLKELPFSCFQTRCLDFNLFTEGLQFTVHRRVPCVQEPRRSSPSTWPQFLLIYENISFSQGIRALPRLRKFSTSAHTCQSVQK
jgi:hypothetical protein